jgi:DNA-binding response OmpR family regulator
VRPCPRILLVEDEEHLARALEFNLGAAGYEVETATSGRAALERLGDAHGNFELVILDVMLPELSGFEVARRLRAAGNFVSILMLTALDQIADRVRGLEEGADDYLSKPFRLEELLARVKGLLRRRRWDGQAGQPETREPVRIGASVVHFDRFELEGPAGRVQLTPREMGLLRVLLDHAGEAVTRGELLEEVWGLLPDTRTRVVDSFVVRLRRYLGEDPADPRHIVSVRGHGYRLVL